jgi:hypothetical protein
MLEFGQLAIKVDVGEDDVGHLVIGVRGSS